MKTLVIAFLFFSAHSQAQQLIRSYFGSGGGVIETTSVNYSYSVGEAVVFSGTLSNGSSINQGVQQKAKRITVDPLANVYTAFSPNGDGTNDTWVIDDLDLYLNNSVTVFNRWGDELVTFTNYDNLDVVWDGTSANGQKLGGGTYFYIIKLEDGRTTSGWVQIVK